VKTGCLLLREENVREAASSSNKVEVKKFWTRIWKLKTPNKGNFPVESLFRSFTYERTFIEA